MILLDGGDSDTIKLCGIKEQKINKITLLLKNLCDNNNHSNNIVIHPFVSTFLGNLASDIEKRPNPIDMIS